MLNQQPSRASLTLTALSVEDAAAVLARVGGRPITAEMLWADVAAGAPVNSDGTVNLVHYAAWLVRARQHGQATQPHQAEADPDSARAGQPEPD